MIIDWFVLLRNIGFTFATLMLVKYYIFLIISPFYPLKEKFRKIKVIRKHACKKFEPLVSIIIPAWNEEIGVVKSVKSLLNSTYDKFEIILVNDGSTDSTENVCNSFIKLQSKDDQNKIIYSYKQNGGKGSALNHGILKSSGEIIVTMDADSVFDKYALENLVEYFKDPKINAVVGNVKVSNNNTLIGYLQQLEYLFGFYYKRTHAVLDAEYIFGGACAAFRRENTFDKYGLFDTENKTEDIEMSMRLKYNGVNSTYAENVICYTEGASNIYGLVNQRLRWKKGRFDTFIKYRRMFFSLDKRHNKFLSFFILPFSLLAEIQLFFEPIALTLLVTYSIISGDYLSLALGNLFVFVIYLVNAFFSHSKFNIKLVFNFFFSWSLFYILVWIEYLALVKSLQMIIRGEDVEWQNWQRVGVSEVIL